MNGTVASPGVSSLWMRVVFGRSPRRTLIRLITLVSISFVLFRFVLIPIRVSGLSMLPTYSEGRISFVNHMAYRWKRPQRGDVVALRLPYENNVVLLKRIVGLPGERVRVADGRVFINGHLLAEPYAKKTDGLSFREVELAPGECFVVGDNRRISVLGPVPERFILGKVLF